MTAPARRRQADTTPAAVCRCPEGWPQLMAAVHGGELVSWRRHHLSDCGLPAERVQPDR